MMQIINGVRYDTTTATLMGEYDNGYPTEDIRWSITQLYKTKAIKYFFYGHGGPGSAYSRKDNCCTYADGEKIIPVTLFEVIVWGEEYLPENVLETIIRVHEYFV
jgi:hypothetical protein